MKRNYHTEPQYDHYTVKEEAPLLEYLLETIKGQSRSKIKATLQGRGIKVDGKLVTQFDFPLKPGMKVTVSKSKRNDPVFFLSTINKLKLTEMRTTVTWLTHSTSAIVNRTAITHAST